MGLSDVDTLVTKVSVFKSKPALFLLVFLAVGVAPGCVATRAELDAAAAAGSNACRIAISDEGAAAAQPTGGRPQDSGYGPRIRQVCSPADLRPGDRVHTALPPTVDSTNPQFGPEPPPSPPR